MQKPLEKRSRLSIYLSVLLVVPNVVVFFGVGQPDGAALRTPQGTAGRTNPALRAQSWVTGCHRAELQAPCFRCLTWDGLHGPWWDYGGK